MTVLARNPRAWSMAALAVPALGLMAGFHGSFFSSSGLVTAALVVIVAIGLTFVVAAGGIDFSVGPVAALAACVTQNIAMALVIGVVCGLVNAILVTRTSIAPYLVTLATSALLIGAGPPASMDGEVAKWLDVPVAVWVAGVVAVIAHVVLTRTRLGLHVYFVGANETTARLSGIRPNPVRLLVYVVSGALAALGGALAAPAVGSAMRLDLIVLTAVVIGGVRLSGGRGTVLGTVLGSVLCVQALEITTMWGVSDYAQRCGLIVVLLLVVAYHEWRLRRQALVRPT